MRQRYVGLATVLLVAVTMFSAVVSVSAAESIQPPTGPSVIAQRTFATTADGTGAASYPNYFQSSPKAWWGIRSGVGANGTAGLWCAQVQTSAVKIFPNYPIGTSGLYDIALPQLSGYYDASARFWYKAASRGDADSPAFVFHWFEGSVSGSHIDAWPLEGLTSTGVTLEYDLTDPENIVNLSRSAGGLRWRFTDRAEAAAASIPIYDENGVFLYTKVVYTPVKTGTGPTIDDVVVEGYAFGPVRNLSADSTGAAVRLTWSRPYAARGAVALEDRSVEYRIWRRPLSANPGDLWTELSISPLADASASVSALDGTAVQGTSYAYLVAPYAVGSTTAYGEPQEVAGRLAAPDLDISVSAAPKEIVSGENVTFVYTVSNNGSTGLTDVMVVDEWGAVAGPLSLTPGQTTQLPPRIRAVTTSKAYQATASSAAQSLETVALSEFIRALNPSISVSVAPAERHANNGKHADFDVTVDNTSVDTPLTNVRVTLGTTTLDAGVLNPGGPPATLTVSVPVTGDATLDVSARGTFLPGRVVDDADNVQVDVVVDESRIAGTSRVTTALDAARRLYPSGIQSTNVDGRRAVVIATGYGFPDALSAASLSGAAGGPLLLVKPNDATSAVLDYIDNELNANYAYIVGGEAVVSDAVRAQLQGIGLQVSRLSGSNRYATAQSVASEVARIQTAKGQPVDTVFVATGLNFPDALAASSLSAAMPAPVLLTKPTSLPSQTAAALALIKPSDVVVCGGTAVVSSSVATSINGNPAYGSPAVVRMPGSDRYETARLLIEWGIRQELGVESGIDGVLLATGTNYPDALAGGALAGGADGTWRPLMLTKPTALSGDARTLILDNKHVSFVTVIGGATVVSDAVKFTAMSLFD